MTKAIDIAALGQAGMAALNAGDGPAARRAFQDIIDAGHGDVAAYLALALACLAMGDADAAIFAADQVLEGDPSNLRGLILKGDALWLRGDQRGASSFYSAAVSLADGAGGLPPDVAGEVARVRARHDDFTRCLDVHVRNCLRDRTGSGERFDQSLDMLSGRARRFFQQPRTYYFPGLACIEFYNTRVLDWAAPLERRIPCMVAELRDVLASPPPAAFSPYIHATGNVPLNPDHPLLDNPDWSAMYLVKNGTPTQHAAALQETMDALYDAPLERIPGRGPNILISRLVPGARIEPHVGYLNTRLTCHVPIILPGRCGIRVGNTVREWREGELLVFNDSIDHEAWNESDRDRYVLIFQVWRPELTDEERGSVSALLQAVDSFAP